MPIVQQGSINTTALVVPDLYVQIVPPQNLVLNGVPTNVVGVVGTASWGPVGQPVIVATMADYAQSFGPILARKYRHGHPDRDSGAAGCTELPLCPGHGQYRLRRADRPRRNDSDLHRALHWVARQSGYPDTDNGIKGEYLAPDRLVARSATGSLRQHRGIRCSFLVDPGHGRKPGTGTTARPLTVDRRQRRRSHHCTERNSPSRSVRRRPVRMAQSTLRRRASQAPIFPRARACTRLRGQGCGIAMLADADDPDYWTTQAGFGLEEGIYMILTGPAGDTIQNAVTVKQQAGLDSYAAKLMFGDWLWWSDQVNATIRLVSPQGFAAGRLANLSPEQSSLNKQLYSVIGSQKSGTPGSGQNASYSSADLAVLLGAGIDVISNPQPGGTFWGVRGGHNSSSNAAINGDNYTRLTNYIAATLAAGMGLFVGQVITADLFRRIRVDTVGIPAEHARAGSTWQHRR